MIGCVIRLLQGLLWHRGHHSINRHEEIILATAPLGKLVLCEARIERALGHKWLVLMRHLLTLLLHCKSGFFLSTDLFLLATSAAIVVFLVLLVSLWLWLRVAIFGLLTIDDRVKRFVSTSTRASCPLLFSLSITTLSSYSALCVLVLILPSSIPGRLWSLSLSSISWRIF